MNYFIFKDQIFTVFLSMAHLSVVSFQTKIQDYVGGERSDFKIHELNKGKSLVFETKRSGFSKNFVVFSKEGKYHFNLKYDEVLSIKDIVLKEAKTCKFFSLLKESKDYKLFECPRSLYFLNNEDRSVKLNNMSISKDKFISKGPPVFLEGKLIYLNGVAL